MVAYPYTMHPMHTISLKEPACVRDGVRAVGEKPKSLRHGKELVVHA